VLDISGAAVGTTSTVPSFKDQGERQLALR